MADINRELAFEDGGRPYNNLDFESLQNSIESALKIYKQFTVTDTNQNSWIVDGFEPNTSTNSMAGQEGFVWIKDHIRFVESRSQTSFNFTISSKLYIGIKRDETESRLYKDGNVKVAFNVYKAVWLTETEKNNEGLLQDEVIEFDSGGVPSNGEIAIDNNRLKNSGYTKSIGVDADKLVGDVELVGAGGITISADSNNTITFNQGSIAGHPPITTPWPPVNQTLSNDFVLSNITAVPDTRNQGHIENFDVSVRQLSAGSLKIGSTPSVPNDNNKIVVTNSTGNLTASSKDVNFLIPSGAIIMYSGSLSNFNSSGLGISAWTGWALCNGSNGTTNLRDKFIVGSKMNSTGSYNQGATGGANTVALSTANLAAHKHTINGIGDHTHGISVLNKSFSAVNTSNTGDHTHGITVLTKLAVAVTTSYTGSHTHKIFSAWSSNSSAAGGSASSFKKTSNRTNTTVSAGDHSHTLTVPAHKHTASATTTGSHAHTFTTPTHNHSASSAASGSHTHTMNNTGSGSAHENRPPYYALAYVMKL